MWPSLMAIADVAITDVAITDVAIIAVTITHVAITHVAITHTAGISSSVSRSFLCPYSRIADLIR